MSLSASKKLIFERVCLLSASEKLIFERVCLLSASKKLIFERVCLLSASKSWNSKPSFGGGGGRDGDFYGVFVFFYGWQAAL